MNVDELAKSTNEFVSSVFKIVAGARKQHIAGDSLTPVYSLSQSQIDEIQELTANQITANYLDHGITTQTLQEARNELYVKLAGDSLINSRTNVGTMIDPTIYTHSTVPIMLGPHEVTALYASGGLPASIIDKKSRAMIAGGLTFKTWDDDLWSADKVELLEEAAKVTGLDDVLSDGICDAFLYGGSIVYPVFKEESPTSFARDIESLNLEKGCVDRWINIDRWNITTVPSFLVTQKDFINPKTMFIPQSAVEINTSRMAILRPKPMPYWAVLYNLGWSPSDFCGWMRAYYGYEITMQSVPVMAQQMSLILYKMPIDALNATIGPNQVKDLMAINEEKMSAWSATNPKAVNMIGDVEVVDRTYSGFEQFMGSMKSNLAAQCEIPEPSLWHTPNKGFSDNTQESLLKQSETLQTYQRFIERSLNNIKNILICHVFGKDSKEYSNKDKLVASLNKPVISTEKDLAEVGARFAASVSSFAQSGVSPDIAISLAKPFFPSVRITDEMISAAKKSYEQAQASGEKLGSGGNSLASSGNNATVGHFGKAK